MTVAERGDITNGIWLCRNCHKAIDADAERFPPNMLLIWRSSHERQILDQIGKKNDIIRQDIITMNLNEYRNVSLVAKQIAIDKPPYWEYKLSAEILRVEIGRILRRWDDVKQGYVVRPLKVISDAEIWAWYSAKFSDLTLNIAALQRLFQALTGSWGPPGVPGDEKEILRACHLIADAANQFLVWEESIRFSQVPENCTALNKYLEGLIGPKIDTLMTIPDQISKIFDSNPKEGSHEITIVFDLPEKFEEEFGSLLNEAASGMID